MKSALVNKCKDILATFVFFSSGKLPTLFCSQWIFLRLFVESDSWQSQETQLQQFPRHITDHDELHCKKSSLVPLAERKGENQNRGANIADVQYLFVSTFAEITLRANNFFPTYASDFNIGRKRYWWDTRSGEKPARNRCLFLFFGEITGITVSLFRDCPNGKRWEKSHTYLM